MTGGVSPYESKVNFVFPLKILEAFKHIPEILEILFSYRPKEKGDIIALSIEEFNIDNMIFGEVRK